MRTLGMGLALAAALALSACTTGTDSGAPGATQDVVEQPEAQYLSWSAQPDGGSRVFSTVYDTKSEGSLIVARSSADGTVESTFGPGSVAGGVYATQSGQIAVSRQAGKLDWFQRGSDSKYTRTGSADVRVPGQTEAPFLNGVVPAGSGAWLTAASVGASATGIPDWLGVIGTNKSGKTTGTWTVPADPDLPENAFNLPVDLTLAEDGSVYVLAIPCQAGLCGSPVMANGHLYQLKVAKGGSISMLNSWATPVAVGSQHIAAVSDDRVILTQAVPVTSTPAPWLPEGLSLGTGETSAEAADQTKHAIGEYQLRPGTVTHVGNIVAANTPTNLGVKAGGQSPVAYVLELSDGMNGSYTIQPFRSTAKGWEALGEPWPAQWGSNGP